MLEAILIGVAVGISIATLYEVIRLHRRVVRCEDTQEYLISVLAARLIATWLLDANSPATVSARAGDGAPAGDDGAAADADGTATDL